ncbi:hypothetical protein [Glutamicibacter sp. NPDC087344]|uniref:hypothetical protein n=1 Tax=Glutamicibacter sp. NPDC087344 TaxID=3363994 RepID=UPI0038055C56
MASNPDQWHCRRGAARSDLGIGAGRPSRRWHDQERHFDKRFGNPDYFDQDSQPVYRQIGNLHITDGEGGALLGDFIKAPEGWLRLWARPTRIGVQKSP